MQKPPKKNRTDLVQDEAIQKLKELVKNESVCHFCTNLTESPIRTRPMSTQEVDDDGTIWFMSSKKSQKNEDLQKDNKVQLFYSNTSNYEFLSVFGTASISTDRAKIKELWSPFAKAWFTKGSNDPDISLIKVVPDNTYYWDTKSSKMVSLVKMLISTVTGKSPDDGVEGKLSVKGTTAKKKSSPAKKTAVKKSPQVKIKSKR
ncbi:MAG TPA: pyridoxamine 5'-phosphate oxidase family protein [Bacteroidia bacterium]|nr:pyridoxamine 5'-phosphate oxidase family protein [Bacteroidia bacterium]